MPKQTSAGSMKAAVVVKLGGSAITDKSRICTPRLDLIHRAADEIAAYPRPLILLHGGGSFAHPFVTKDLLLSHFEGALTALLALGVIPLIHGDLAVNERRGFGVVSADRIASLLGEKLEVSRVLFGCDVDGVYPVNRDGSRSSRIIRIVDKSNYSSVLNRLELPTKDATGGMRGKVLEALRLARHGVESYIFNLKTPSNLTRLLNGSSSVGTRFVAWK